MSFTDTMAALGVTAWIPRFYEKYDLQPIPVISPRVGVSANSSEGAQLDDAMNGFWGGRYERTFIDVRVLALMLTLIPVCHIPEARE